MTVLDVAAGACLLLGAGLAFAAGVGMVRFPGTLSRMHAATKPQVLGLQLVLLAMWLRHPRWAIAGTLLLIAVYQVVTVAVAAYMVGRAAYLAESPRDDGTAVPPGDARA
ncbi:monovalent cation/H(+) antiporter subunit G [Streptosporangium sp. NPDC023963]|uniref:monovalent cation/H(+) antiporter subunit G n=1 Tax=Streptosporangium sp. NPDC023963 TaxID=3155608 RepID=UPI0034416CA9